PPNSALDRAGIEAVGISRLAGLGYGRVGVLREEKVATRGVRSGNARPDAGIFSEPGLRSKARAADAVIRRRNASLHAGLFVAVAGHEVDDAGKRIRAVQHRAGAPDHLD